MLQSIQKLSYYKYCVCVPEYVKASIASTSRIHNVHILNSSVDIINLRLKC